MKALYFRGVSIGLGFSVCLLEILWLEDLAKDQVYEFAFIAAPIKLRGATGSPIRPLALPIRAETN